MGAPRRPILALAAALGLTALVLAWAAPFGHIRTDRGTRSISGKGITERSQPLTVTDAGADVGVLDLQGTGRIVGQVFRPPDRGGGVWAFAEGDIRRARNVGSEQQVIDFQADEHGRFEADGVPAGDNRVSVHFRMTAHMGGTHVRAVRVLPGQTTEVYFFDSARKENLILDFVIGDGSRGEFQAGTGMGARRRPWLDPRAGPRLEIGLTPLQERPASVPVPDRYNLPPEGPARVVLPDVSPGTYRVRVADWPDCDRPESQVGEAQIDVTPERRSFRIPLGAGSVSGTIQGTGRTRLSTKVLAVSEKDKTLRVTRRDYDGTFCVRYLPEGRWTLYAHDEQGGWCRLGIVPVKNDTQDLGVHRLTLGGRLTGKAAPRKDERSVDAVVAVDAQGFQIEAEGFVQGRRDEFTIRGLWPGHWTVQLLSGKTVQATARAEIRGTESVRCDLTAP